MGSRFDKTVDQVLLKIFGAEGFASPMCTHFSKRGLGEERQHHQFEHELLDTWSGLPTPPMMSFLRPRRTVPTEELLDHERRCPRAPSAAP